MESKKEKFCSYSGVFGMSICLIHLSKNVLNKRGWSKIEVYCSLTVPAVTSVLCSKVQSPKKDTIFLDYYIRKLMRKK